MSIERCHKCERYIDTDFDSECYVDIGNMRRTEHIVPLCHVCREDCENHEGEATGEVP